MKKIILSGTFMLACFLLSAQPCKLVKIGMSQDEVEKLVGKPTEVDDLGADVLPDGSETPLFVWQYGNPKESGNQRVFFMGDKVSDVVADGKKYDELIADYEHDKFPKEELEKRIEKLNAEACK